MSAPVLLLAVLLGVAGPVLAAPASGEETAAATDVIDLNTATVEQLCTLPGIGQKKAEAILALREKRPFTRLTQLLLVRGIGPKTLSRLKPRLTVTPPTGATLTAPASPTSG